MKFKVLALASIVSVGLTIGCGNLYESAANKNPKEAQTDELETAFVKGDCGKVINLLKGEILQNRKNFKNSSSEIEARNQYALNKKNDYMYINSAMICSGFSTLAAIDTLANDSEASKDIFYIVGKLAGVSHVNLATAESKTNGYNEAYYSCELMPVETSTSQDPNAPKLNFSASVNNTTKNQAGSPDTTPPAENDAQVVNGVLIDDDYKIVCGLSSSVISILQVANMTIEMTKENSPTEQVELRQKSIETMLQNVEGKTLIKTIDDFINDKSHALDEEGNSNKPVNNINKYGNYMTQNINFIQGASQVIADTLNNESFKATINDFAKDILDPKEGRITKISLVNYFLKLQGQDIKIETWEQYTDCLNMTSDTDKGSCPINVKLPTTQEIKSL